MRNIYDYIKDPIFLKKMKTYEHLDDEEARKAFDKKMEEYFSSLPIDQQEEHNQQFVEDIHNIIKMVDADIADLKKEKEDNKKKKDPGFGRRVASITL